MFTVSPGLHAQGQTGDEDPQINPPVNGSNLCPAQDEITKGNVHNFLTKSSWAENRQETGVVGVDANQLQVLSSYNSQDQSACEFLNNEYSLTINEKWPDGSIAYDVAYYKAGNFYFVSIVVAQPDDSNEVAVGLSFIDIYDENLNRIKGYSF